MRGLRLHRPGEPLDAALIFAPVGALVPKALADRIQSVANLTRADGVAFMEIAARIPLQVAVQPYPFADAQRALDDLRAGRTRGAAVLVM